MSILLTILAVLGWVSLFLLGVLALVIALPLDLQARGGVDSEEDEPRYPLAAAASVRAMWGWGLLSVAWGTEAGGEVRILGIRVARFQGGSDDEKKEKKKKAKKEKKKDSKYSPRWAMRHRHTMLELLGRFVRALRLRLAVSGALGLGDPADTVMLVEILRLAEGQLSGADLDIDVDYLDEILVLEGVVSGRIWLAHLGGIALWELRRREVRLMLAGR